MINKLTSFTFPLVKISTVLAVISSPVSFADSQAERDIAMRYFNANGSLFHTSNEPNRQPEPVNERGDISFNYLNANWRVFNSDALNTGKAISDTSIRNRNTMPVMTRGSS